MRLAPALASHCLNSQSRDTIENLVKNIEKIETAMEPKFQDYFVDAMAFPNKTDAFPNLFSVVVRPEPKRLLKNSGTVANAAADKLYSGKIFSLLTQ